MEQRSLKLEVGEKFLSISLLGSVNIVAFPNKNKSNPQDPDYIGNGVAIWIKQKKSEIKQQPTQIKQVSL